MRDLKLFEEYWGNLIFSFCFGKIDILPRVTLSQLTGAFIINIGILFFTLNLTIWDESMREFNRRNAQNGYKRSFKRVSAEK